MAQFYTLSWVPGASASSQTVQYRVKNTGSWVDNVNITPANPLTAAVTSATISDLSTNAVYQFQVLSNCCPGTGAAGTVLEGIIYEQVDINPSVAGGIISVTQDPMPAVDIIAYRLATQGDPGTILQTVTATGTNPSTSFSEVGSDTYVVTYAYTTAVNGVNINSYDADQNDDWYSYPSTVVVA